MREQEARWRETLAAAIVGELPPGNTRLVDTPATLAVLLAIEARERVTVGGLAETLGVGLGTVGDWIKRCEANGLVERWKDHVDHRRTWVSLTTKGQQARRAARGRRNADEGS